MIILFEEYHYETEKLKNILSERYFYAVNSIYSKINYVGYYFNSQTNEAVILFPKVFINDKLLVFDEFVPEVLINPTFDIKEKLFNTNKGKIVFEISTWLYRAIQQFNKRKKDNQISENQFLNQVVTNLQEKSNTELDIILSLLKFYKENQSLFSFISKSANSQQNKINWTKTINKKQPTFRNNSPIYLDLNSTKKNVNYDEELLVIFYSTLNFIKDKYAFEFHPPQNYELIKGYQFEKFSRTGCRYLKRIKYRYYSDKLINLYNLLYSFFERSEKTQSKKQFEEILLVRDFNIVFEDMIDDLISDQNIYSEHKELKNQKDGKQIDHLYRYTSLIIKDEIYFVGDSKYYKTDNNVGKYSQAKQFTYAKNVIQYNIDLFNDDTLDEKIRYRDPLTEGYNITPNFFISAFVNNDFNFTKPWKLNETCTTITQTHFKNRLFDRDTLFIQHYNINFLFVLSAYLTKNSSLKSNFKKETQIKIRGRLVNYLNEKYNFYILKPKENTFIQKHFKLLNGKLYRPAGLTEELILALEKPDKIEILTEIHTDISSVELYTLT